MVYDEMQMGQGAAFITSRKTTSDHECEIFEATLEVSIFDFGGRQTAVLGGGGKLSSKIS